MKKIKIPTIYVEDVEIEVEVPKLNINTEELKEVEKRLENEEE